MYWISCCSHADQILPKLRPLHNKIDRSHSKGIDCDITATFCPVFGRCRKIAKSDHWLHVCPSDCSFAWNNFDFTGILIKFDIWVFFWKYIDKFFVWLKYEKKAGTWHEYLCTVMITSRWSLLRMRNISYIRFVENQNTFTFRTFFFLITVPVMR